MRRLFLTAIFFVTLFHLPFAYSKPNTNYQCAKLSTVVHFTSKNQRSLGLVTHNGKRIQFPSDSFRKKGLLSSIPMVLALEPGYHEFSAIPMMSKNSNEISTINREIPPLDNEFTTQDLLSSDAHYSRNEIHFGIEVLPNTIYRIVLQKTEPKTLAPGKEFHVVVKSIKETQCNSKKIRKALPRNTVVNHTKKLPEELQFRLDALSKDIQAYYKQFDTKNSSLNFFFPTRKEENFGIVVAMDNQPSEGLLLLAVAPLTTASKLGLQHLDKIISINGQSLTNTDTVSEALTIFQEEIFETEAGDTLQLKLVRNDKTIVLSSDYSLISLPEVKLSLKMPTKIPEVIK